MRDLDCEYKAKLGTLIKAARAAAGMSQTELAVALQAGDGSIVSHWERGTRWPSPAQLEGIAKETRIAEASLQEMRFALLREDGHFRTEWMLEESRPEGLIEDLKHAIESVRQLRSIGQPRQAVNFASRAAASAQRRLRQFKWSHVHPVVLASVAVLVLEEVKAALDYLPRREIRFGGLEDQLHLLAQIGKILGDTRTKFMGSLAIEGATYVSGDVKRSYKQTRFLLDRSELIQDEYMPEVLRAAAINAGKARNHDALLDVQSRISVVLPPLAGSISQHELGYLLEGLARGWGAFDPGRGRAIAEEAAVASGLDGSLPPNSALRFVQLVRTEAEIELARFGEAPAQRVRDRVAVALEVSRREHFDRYVDQLTTIGERLG